MVPTKFGGVQQHPKNIAHPTGALVFAGPTEKRINGLSLCGRRRPAECAEIQRLDLSFDALWELSHHMLQSLAGRRHRRPMDIRSVHEGQGLRDQCLGVAGRFAPFEQAEQASPERVFVVFATIIRRGVAGRLSETVQKLLAGKTLDRPTREQFGLGLTGVGLPACPLVCPAQADRALQEIGVEARGPQGVGQLIEQFGMAGRIRIAEVVNGIDKPASHEL
jgi:hypothetical protein